MASASSSGRVRTLHWVWPAAAVALAGAAALMLDVELSEAYDQDTFHVPAIRIFASQLPFPDVSSYQSATTPLLYLVMAAAVRAGIESLEMLRLLSLALSVAGVLALEWFFAQFTDTPRAAVYAAAVGMSPYYLGSAIFVVTDNPPFALMTIALTLALPAREARPAVSAVIVAAVIMMRQIYVWLIPFVAASSSRDGIDRRGLAWLLLPVSLLAGILWLWGGPLPRGYTAYQHPPSLLPLIAVLTTVGWWGAPLLPALASTCHRRRAGIVFIGVAVAATVLLASAPITAGHPSPWGGGMRTLGKYGGTMAGTSFIYWVGMLLGSAMVAVIAARPHAPHERVLLVACVFWAAAQCLNAAMPDRYYQPFVLLILFALASGLRGRAATLGTAALIAAILAASFVRFAIHGTGILRL